MTSADRPGRRDSATRINRKMWNRESARYDRRHRRTLARAGGMSWGFWRVPESTLGLLGPIRGRATLEIGCGAGRWSAGLRRKGARPVGIDLSEEQLKSARAVQRRRGASFPLVHGSAEALPFRDARFDIAFCDWGALTFADPRRAIPEAARVLKRGGRLVFATSSPFRSLSQSRRTGRISARLRYPYFSLHRLDYPGEVNYQLSYAEWIGLFRRCGLMVDRLVELPTPRRARTTYVSRAERRWGSRWPLESIWALEKR